MKETVSIKIKEICSRFINRKIDKSNEQLKENNKMTNERFEKLLELKNKIGKYEEALKGLQTENSLMCVKYRGTFCEFETNISDLCSKEALVGFMNKQLKQLKDEFERG